MSNESSNTLDQSNSQKLSHLYSSAFLIAYLLIGFVPNLGTVDQIAPQWLYLNSVSVLAAIYILKNHAYFSSAVGSLFKTKFSWLYAAFIVWASASYFYAINPTEVLVNLARVVGTSIAFVNVFVLLQKIPNKFRLIAMVATGALIIEMYMVLDPLLGLLKQGANASRSSLLKGTTGNINIAALSLVIKMPFALYLMNLAQKTWQRMAYGVLITLTIFCLVLIASRASYVALVLSLILYIAFCLYNYFRAGKPKRLLIPILYFVVPFVVAVGISELSTAGKNNTSFFERSATIVQATTDGSIAQRLRFYTAGLEHILNNPIVGSGLGNWKLVSILYEKEFINGYVVPYHVHNDFIQIGAELGIPGFFMYLGLFGVLLFYIVYIAKSKLPENTKFFVAFLTMSLSTYMVDGALNFPIARPIMQMVWLLVMALIVLLFLDAKAFNKDHKPIPMKNAYWVSVVCLILLAPLTYITYQTNESLKGQQVLFAHYNTSKFTYPLNKVDKLVPGIPNISVTTLPIASMKANYYIENGQDDKALEMLRTGIKANPYLGYSELLMSKIFFKKNQRDSATYYAKAAYDRVANTPHFSEYLNLLLLDKNLQEIDRIFAKDSSKHKPIVWKNYIVASNTLRPPRDSVSVSVANRAKDLFPADKDILLLWKIALLGKEAVDRSLALSQEGSVFFQQQDYMNAAQKFSEAAALDPLEFSYFENTGAAYFSAGLYELSLPYFDKVIQELNPKSGKSEYIKGLALINLGRNEAACAMFKAAKALRYPAADLAISEACNYRR
ncbi:O-antigen ligase family protein [Flavobacteriaceae bacterium]|nr:O-antigen ligase family protein [Flavobacteriaceae bacterium]